MADVDIVHGCGCGYKTRSLEAAIRHSETEHHTLTVFGTIKTAKPTPNTGRNRPQAQTAKGQFKRGLDNIDSLSRIRELRAKINGGK